MSINVRNLKSLQHNGTIRDIQSIPFFQIVDHLIWGNNRIWSEPPRIELEEENTIGPTENEELTLELEFELAYTSDFIENRANSRDSGAIHLMGSRTPRAV